MDMKRLVMTVVAAGAALAAAAMPTKKELQKAQEMVADVTESDVKALRSGAKTPAEVAARHMELAGQAASEAEKYLLLQGAFKLYAKAGDYDAAADALGTMNREIADMNPEVIVEIYNRAIFRSMKEKAPKLHAIKEAARRQVFYRKQLAKAEAAVKANPKDPAAQKKLGECHAELGDWPKALDAFALADGTLAKTAKAELDGSLKPQELGDFWWDYESGDEMSTYKLHAAELYRTALADDSFKGLARTRADQRVKEAQASGIDLPTAALVAQTGNVGTRASAPKSVANRTFDLGCERKLEMIACPAGEFTMGEKTVKGDCNEVRKHQVKITRPFWLSKVPVTVAQWNEIFGQKAEKDGEKASGGHRLLEKRQFFEKLNAKFAAKLPKGYVFRLPTEAEAAYALTAGGKDKVSRKALGIDKEKPVSWGKRCEKPVGQGKTNSWGFSDILGHSDLEFLDIVAVDSSMRKLKLGEKAGQIVNVSYADEEQDPLCWDSSSGETDFKNYFGLCGSSDEFWTRTRPDGLYVEWNTIFRVCLGPDLVAEKNTKGAGAVGREDGKGPDDKPVSAAVKAPAPKCKMVNGRPEPLKFELAKGIDLELEGCPAGKFTMGYDFRHGSGWNSDGKSAPKHEVKITRPFWIGKYQVTRGQFKALGFERHVDERTMMALNAMDGKGGRNCATQSSLSGAERFCGELNKRFRDRLPKGYVFRLPSDAEWEYASKAGDYSANNPAMAYAAPPHHFPGCALYSEVCKEMVQKKMEWKHGRIPPGPVGTKKPNAWGMYDAVGNGFEMLLDRLPRSNEEIVRYDKKYTDVVVDLKPPKDSNDPLIYHEGDDYVCLARHERLLKEVIAGRKEGTATFRVCLGPDLVAEKKARK